MSAAYEDRARRALTKTPVERVEQGLCGSVPLEKAAGGPKGAGTIRRAEGEDRARLILLEEGFTPFEIRRETVGALVPVVWVLGQELDDDI